MGKAAKPLSREQILQAMKFTGSNRGAARYLGVSYNHYRRYASMYKDEKGVCLYDKHRNQSGKGIKKFAATPNYYGSRNSQKEPAILDILNGRVPSTHFNPQKLKYSLIQMGMLECKCYQCGFKETRLIDGKSPLILHHKNGNKNDWKLENLGFLCYNCSFLNGGVDCPITEGFVEKAEDALEREGYGKLAKTEAFELDDFQKQFLQNLGLRQEEPAPGSQYISRL